MKKNKNKTKFKDAMLKIFKSIIIGKFEDIMECIKW
jgi:hypothetical protein